MLGYRREIRSDSGTMKKRCKAEVKGETVPWGEQGEVFRCEEPNIAVVSPVPETPEKV